MFIKIRIEFNEWFSFDDNIREFNYLSVESAEFDKNFEKNVFIRGRRFKRSILDFPNILLRTIPPLNFFRNTLRTFLFTKSILLNSSFEKAFGPFLLSKLAYLTPNKNPAGESLIFSVYCIYRKEQLTKGEQKMEKRICENIALLLTSASFEKFYNEFVVCGTIETDPVFIEKIGNLFGRCFEQSEEMVLFRADIQKYFSENGGWVESKNQAKVFLPTEKPILVSLQDAFGKLYGEDDVIVLNKMA